MSYWVLAGGDGVRRGVWGGRDCSHPRSSQDCWEPCCTAGAPHRGICPAAAGPSGRCGTRCGGCSGGWRRACAAPAAIPREKPPRPGGSWWPADHRPPRTQHPRGRWQEGPGGRWGGGSSHPWLGAALCPTGLGTPPARPISAATGERLGSGRATGSLAVQGGGSGGCLGGHGGVWVVTAAPSPPQGAKPPGAGQGGPWGRTDEETEVGIAAAGRAGAGPG